MSDFNVRSDSVNVEQVMEQIRARIREKRGVDYTEEQIRELATVKLERFLDPRGVRSDLLEEFRRARSGQDPAPIPNYAFEDSTLFDTHRGIVRFIRRLLRPLLKLLFNPNPLIEALHIQSRVNTINAEFVTSRRAFDQLYYELLHNLVLETTRMSIEVKNLKMQVESLTGRLEFNERRARALESAVVYRPALDQEPPRSELSMERPAVLAGAAVSAVSVPAEGPGQRSRRRRRRRGRRGGGSAVSIMSGSPGASAPQAASPVHHAEQEAAADSPANDGAPDEPSPEESSPSGAEPKPDSGQ